MAKCFRCQPATAARIRRVTLTMSNGWQVLLDSVITGELSKQGNMRLLKPDSGTFTYVASDNNSGEMTGKALDLEFGGKMDRSLPLSDLLKFLDKNQIHFRLEGRKLIILPN